MMTSVSPVATFIGANKQTQVCDYNKERQIVAFGAGNTIALWNPLDVSYKGVCATLKGHESEVTCVNFIPGSDYLVSASEDFYIKIWKFASDSINMECVQTIKHNTKTIVTLAVLPGLFAVGCADGLISLWIAGGDEEHFVLGHEFNVQKGFYPLCLALSNIKDDKYILAVGGTSVNIFVYSFIYNGSDINSCENVSKLEGHEDWVKSLAFRHQETPGDYYLASGSQDRYIRVWRIRTNDLIDNSDEDETKLSLLSNKQYKFEIANDLKVAINFEALIMGHDDWVSSVKWHESRFELLASTADTAIMVWEPDETSGIWVCASRLGEISSKGASTATGSTGGFWSCLWFQAEGKDYILTNGKTGSWRVWNTSDRTFWEAQLGITGTTEEVTDIAWSPKGDYLLSTSLDQTVRLFSAWRYNSDGTERDQISWHEFSRPQIHGYDMICIEPISETRFVSGGDEKILRAFDLPRGVSDILTKFAGVTFESNSVVLESASVPALGLSNKAATEDIEDVEDPNERETNENKNISYELVAALTTPPLEDQLQRHLLWPEIEKLYGHGYEITCVGVSPDRKLIASACRSNTATHAVIRIFSIDTWLELKPPLAFHNLTITRLEFSHDSKYLLSVCRDRQWAVWERNFEDNSFTLKYKNEKPHSRIIWDCVWLPEEYGNGFLTASRDKTVKLWKYGNDNYELETSIKLTAAVTSISVMQKLLNNNLIIAIGLEDGSIHIYKYSKDSFEQVIELDNAITPAGRISRLRWSNLENSGSFLLGVGSSDTSTRIYSVQLSDI
ncbi:hypothetical protein Kpol_1050p33 [Vanderwaltozyma polyspora DSM 70294]|uniref:Elongator complex protein 2 n=1 Tax=Vanderwaltozyma polyspora (strain ATCC 22028 / DSM 70294 / BCRC 21397 / CBS 2163 / NBRC 10782 / NRRL Y-8283 / UCD 57-17) TaxID=436907 RepID=A7TET0_VANPO|nr:uncharacterized protein Kpol_1050p33 [Vanderwaltozyma polyspora DSM 70294]EDO19176.1 hypothetical protein Kpol_1050p33 [Vanderwaltozyma polyspora DSM 70294]